MRTAVTLLLALAALPLPGQARTCAAHSPDHTVALVELYTSEGCNSCPPADRWLSGLGARGYVPKRVVPLSLHVDYWDYLGWKDPYAQRRFSARQRRLSHQQRLAIVYTPQVLVQGRDFRQWHRAGAFDAVLERINAVPAQARIALEIHSLEPDAMSVGWDARLLGAAQEQDAALYVATYENKLAGAVTAGENQGRTLEHDFVVLEWRGPMAFSAQGRVAQTMRLPLLPRAVPARSGVAAFVQNRRTLEVLQALMLPACGPAGQ